MSDPRVRRAVSKLLALCALVGALTSTTAALATAAPLTRHARSSRAIAVSASVRPTALMSAARASTRSDRALVRDARRLKRCLLANPHSAQRCASARRALQLAGGRLANTELRLARIARGTAGKLRARSASRSRNPREAPRLIVSGHALKWARVDGIGNYVLERRVPGEARQYSVVNGTSVKPPPMPGMTVRYSVRTTAAMSEWASEQAITYPPAETVPSPTGSSSPETPISDPGTPTSPPQALDPQAAPQITVSGETLSWSPTADVSTYVLVRTVAGHAPEYSEVSATTTTPTPTPGATVRYSVRTAVPGSVWAAEVTISYPAEATAPTPPVTTPPVEESPAQAPPSSSFQPGINAGQVYPGQLDLASATTLGAKIVRVEFPIETPAPQLEATIAGYAAIGVRVDLLATFTGRLPSSAEARNLANWTRAYGSGGTYWAAHGGGQLAVQTIEFGNETDGGYQYGDGAGDASYTARAQTYAIRFKEAAEAIAAAGPHVGLLAVSEDWTGDWMNGMFSAVPNLGAYVGGWVSHPYGPGWKTSIEDIVHQAAAHGAPSSIPIDVTEWGLSTDGGRCLSENYGWNPCMSYQEAAETLSSSVAGIRQLLGSRMGLFLLYQIRDQAPSGANNEREEYFGALQHEMQPKGAYTTAVEQLLGS
jgi:hypothetical protein